SSWCITSGSYAGSSRRHRVSPRRARLEMAGERINVAMRMTRRGFVRLGAAAMAGGFGAPAPPPPAPRFALVQPELFAATGGQPSCWADYDNDGDLDLFVGFKDAVANRLYRNDGGTFVEVAAAAGLPDTADTRAAAWGDPNADGRL